MHWSEAFDDVIFPPLTKGELKVLNYLPSDLNQTEIGAELFISNNTVRTHIRSIYQKLCVSTRRDAVQKAIAEGVLSPQLTIVNDMMLCPFCGDQFTSIKNVRVATPHVADVDVATGETDVRPAHAFGFDEPIISLIVFCKSCTREFSLVFGQNQGETYLRIVPSVIAFTV